MQGRGSGELHRMRNRTQVRTGSCPPLSCCSKLLNRVAHFVYCPIRWEFRNKVASISPPFSLSSSLCIHTRQGLATDEVTAWVTANPFLINEHLTFAHRLVRPPGRQRNQRPSPLTPRHLAALTPRHRRHQAMSQSSLYSLFSPAGPAQFKSGPFHP